MMKKYLMLGVAVLALASCNKNDFEPTTEAQLKEAQYTQAFESTFGQINPNVNWGFDQMTVFSLDKNGAVVTRGHNVNRNEWGTGNGVGGNVAVPKNLNDPSVNANEQTLVYNYFNQVRKNDRSVQVNWTDFFITEVWKGEDVYYDDNQYTWTETAGADPIRGALKADAVKNVSGSDKMDHLQVRKGEGSISASGELIGDWEHANDFNNGDHSSSWESIEGHTFMNNSGTLEFAYLNSTDSKYHNEYLIVPGAIIDPSLAGYFYVAFDFYANGGYVDGNGIMQQKNMRVDRDYKYTDWIVRISPGKFLNAQRVMIEDLIANNLTEVDKSDWDFNDAVFDVAFNNEWVAAADGNKLVAHITLYAAGGTKPLYIGGREVHELFGVSTKTMVNTNAAGGVDNLAPVMFTVIMGDSDWSGTHTADEVPVYVETTELKAEQGKAPQKIVTDTDTRWMQERKLITLGYAKFADYVQLGTPKNWYDEVTDASVLY